MIYRPLHFASHELVDPVTHSRFGDDSLRYLRPELLRSLDVIWVLLNAVKRTAVTINNWRYGGPREWSGLRNSRSPYYKESSAHSVGAAADLQFSTWSVADAWAVIKQSADTAPLMVRRVEDPEQTKTWLHVDVLEHNAPGILVVNP